MCSRVALLFLMLGAEAWAGPTKLIEETTGNNVVVQCDSDVGQVGWDQPSCQPHDPSLTWVVAAFWAWLASQW